jgi:hypothetical protein
MFGVRRSMFWNLFTKPENIEHRTSNAQHQMEGYASGNLASCIDAFFALAFCPKILPFHFFGTVFSNFPIKIALFAPNSGFVSDFRPYTHKNV